MRTRTLIVLAGTLLVWASPYAGIRVGLAGYSPFHLALLRFLVASVVLALLALRLPLRLPRPRDAAAILGAGLLGISIYQIALGLGERATSAGVASLVLALQSVVIAVLAGIFLRERLSLWGWSGSGLALGGVGLIVVSQIQAPVHLGENVLWLLLATVGTSACVVLQKSLIGRYRPFELNAYVIWAGTAFLLPFLPGLGREMSHASWQSTAVVVYLGAVPGALGYLGWNFVLRELPASQAGAALILTSPLGALIGFLWLGERPGLVALLGGLVTLAAAIFVTVWGAKTVCRAPDGSLIPERPARGLAKLWTRSGCAGAPPSVEP
jgi:drug/metabolite transporter (DMT)-like permease